MHRPSVLIAALLLVACGDNYPDPQGGDDGGGDDGGGDDGGVTECSTDLSDEDLDSGQYDDRFTISGFTGFDGDAPRVYDFARDVDGSIVAAGKFQYFGTQRVEPLMRWRNDAWEPARTTWELTPPGAGFAAVAINADGDLALATYDDFGPRVGQIWVDDGSGLRVIASFDGLVRRLVWFDGELWAAGNATIEGVDGLAVWDGTDWSAAPGGAVDGPVFELKLDGEEVLVGGDFDAIGGTNAKNAASFDGTTWTDLTFPDTPQTCVVNPETNEEECDAPDPTIVYALVRDGTQLYAGGSFGKQFSSTTSGVARRDGTGWELLGGGLQNSMDVGVATDLAVHDGSLFVTGCFSSAGDEASSVGGYGVANFDDEWKPILGAGKPNLSPWFEPRGCGYVGDVFDVSYQRVFSAGDRAFFGGMFAGLDGVQSQSIIAFDGSGFQPQGPGGLGVTGNIERIAASDTCDVYALPGPLSHVAGEPSDARLLHFTGTGWEPITDTIADEMASCQAFDVSPTGTAVLGCLEFYDEPVNAIYRVEGTQLVQAVAGLPSIATIKFGPDGTLWISGYGPEGNGVLASWDGTNVTIVEDGFDAPPAFIDPINATDVIVAGEFLQIGDLAVNRIARFAGGTWEALGAGMPGMVTALAHRDDRIYASTYEDALGPTGYLIAEWNGSAWTELATAAANITRDRTYVINSIAFAGDALVAGGNVLLDDDSGRGVVVYRNGAFTSLGGGVNGITISDLAITSDAIWVAGAIAEAGTGDEKLSSIGLARYEIQR